MFSIRLSTAIFALLVCELGAIESGAQERPLKEQILGTWQFVSGDPLWGPNPKGLMTFTENGWFTWQVFRSDRPKFASNDRRRPTPEESLAATEGALAYFGTFTVDESARIIITRVLASTFPNSENEEQKRLVTNISFDELAYTNPSNTSGNAVAAVWKRLK
jgi:hypothetical protein